MKTIKATTKKGNQFLTAYKASHATELRDVYGSYSAAKARAEYKCRVQYINEHGEQFRIISGNTFTFTVGWTTAQGLRIETACNSYLVTF